MAEIKKKDDLSLEPVSWDGLIGPALFRLAVDCFGGLVIIALLLLFLSRDQVPLGGCSCP